MTRDMGEAGFCELSSSTATCIWTNSNYVLEIIPEDVPFAIGPIRDGLARLGTRLLVSVLRDRKVHWHFMSNPVPPTLP